MGTGKPVPITRGKNMQYLGDNPNMFIVRAPLRISLFGGGTDLPEFYEQHGGGIAVSLAIDKYVYAVFNRRFTGGWRVSYNVTEEVGGYEEIWHTLVRPAYQLYKPPPCTLTIIGDMPASTGLGSSSALAVALVRALDFKLNIAGSWRDLAEKAFELERGTGAKVGKQDHYAAVCGGFRIYRFEGNANGRPAQSAGQEHACCPLSELQRWSLLLYTGRTRPAAAILAAQAQHADVGALHEIWSIADAAAQRLLEYPASVDAMAIGQWLQRTWQAKRRVVAGITDAALDAQYEAALAAGAVGGKLLGAGGGGCWFLVVPPSAQQRVKDALGLLEIPWSWDTSGCKAVLGHGAWLRGGESASQRIGESASQRVSESTELPL